MKIGFFGGTFDPVHIGHVRAALKFIEKADLDMLYVVPAYINPFKSSVYATAMQRLDMLKIAFADNEKVTVDDFEALSPSPSYTYLTVCHIKALYPESEVCLLIGDDNLEQIATWRSFNDVLRLCPIYVSARNNTYIADRIANFNKTYGADMRLLDFDATVISASDIRNRMDASMLPAGVYEYITKNRLYALPDRDEVLSKLKGRFSEFRMAHTLGVEKMSLLLAERHAPELDRALVSLSALLHDCTKEYSDEEQRDILRLCRGADEKYLMSHPQLLHAVTGAVVAGRDFGLSDAGCEAVRWHTTGKKDMSMLEKIIFVADFIEDNRRHSACKEVRKAYEEAYARVSPDALDMAIQLSIEKTIEMLAAKGEDIDVNSLETLEWIKTEREKIKNMDNTNDIAVLIARAAKKAFEEKQAIDVNVMSVSARTVLAEYFVVCSAGSSTQLKALADNAEYVIKTELGIEPSHIEGSYGSPWVLMDYGCVALHIFTREGRDFYKLEKLWKDSDAKATDNI